MAKTLYIGIIFIVFLAFGAYSYVYEIPPSKLSVKSKKCYDPDTEAYYDKGSKNRRQGVCEEVQCNFDLSLEVRGCGVVDTPDGCEEVEDKTKPYPDCCPTIQCPNT